MRTSYFDPVFAVIQDYPSVAAGTVTFVVAFALVAGNAFYAQSGTHPEPIWATRDATFTHSVEKNLRPVKTTTIKPRSIPVPVKRTSAGGEPVSSPMVSAVQAALIKTNDYSGEVDGLMGPMTRAAIRQFQLRNNMEPTGNASRKLLAAVQANMPTVTASKSTDSLSRLISTSRDDGFDQELVRLIQAGLARSGRDIEVDGIFGSKTRTAIEEFQRSNNLEVTGKPDPSVLKKMKEKGVVSEG